MREITRWQRVGLGVVLLLAAAFTYFNSGEAVAVSLGLFVLYQVPLVTLIFVAFLLGMVTMFLLGLRHDLKVRRLLHERGFEVPAPPPARDVPLAREIPVVRETPPSYDYEYDAPPPATRPFPPYPPPDPEP